MELLKLALLVSVAGLVILGGIAYFVGPPHIDLNSLESHNGKTVIIQGTIARATSLPAVTFIDLGKERVKVVLFGIPSHKFIKGDLIEVEGKITRYKGELEIIADEVRCLKC